MFDPKLEEFTRAGELKHSFLRNIQAYVRDTIQPQLAEREALIVENASLREQLQKLSTKAAGRKSEQVPA